MINTNPFFKLLEERNLNLTIISQLSGIQLKDMVAFSKGRKLTAHIIGQLCSVLKCQPCDLIEFSKTETKGHWEWIEDKTE